MLLFPRLLGMSCKPSIAVYVLYSGHAQFWAEKNKNIFSPILALDTIFEKFKDQKIFIITVDTPFVSVDSIYKLIKESKDYDICVAQTEKTHNLCGVFSSNISSTIKTMIQNDIHKIGYLLNNSIHKILNFPNDGEFININNKDDYKIALENII